MSQRYPLSWPEGWKRTEPSRRRYAKFGRHEKNYIEGRPSYAGKRKISIQDAIGRIAYELERNGVDPGEIVISTNLPLNIYGAPRGDRGEPGDPGVAVYWTRKKRAECMAIDRYTRVADNLAAIAATLEALRTIERHGGGEILERAFRGFTALPEAAGGKSWRDVLNFHASENPSVDEVRERYRRMAMKRHPDHGGSAEDFHELQWAVNAATAERGEGQRTR